MKSNKQNNRARNATAVKASWDELKQLGQSYQNFSIPKHLETASIEAFTKTNQNVYFDFSKVLADERVLDALLNYANSIGLFGEIQKLFKGEQLIDSNEPTYAWHPAIRGSMDHLEVVGEIKAQREKMARLVQLLNSQRMRGYSGRAIKHLVHIGVGGSEFGVKAFFDGLQTKKTGIQTHFISSLDGLEMERLLAKHSIDQMLFVVVSKSFKTEDTLNNAEYAKKELLQRTSFNAMQHHFIGVSANSEAMSEFGIHPKHQLPIWNWLSGRYSSFSSVAFSLAVNIGMERFSQILAGAQALDTHFKNESQLKNNIPVLFALLHFWHFTILNLNTLAIFPYDALLQQLPVHLQQLIMESLGKQANRNSQMLDYPTSPIVLGDLGTRSQHAFYQQLYQGKPKLLAHFLLTAQSKKENPIFHQRSQLHALVQSFGLAVGQASDDPNQHYPGNLPVIQIALPLVNDFYLGYLFALYEQIVFAWSVLLNVNAFDQPGVEYGKKLAAASALSESHIEPQAQLDNFSNRLIDWLNQHHDQSAKPKGKK